MKLNYVICSFLVLIGAAIMGRGLYDVYRAFRSVSWTVVEATIIASESVTRSRNTRLPRITFQYEVLGVVQESSLVYFGQGISSKSSLTTQLLSQYPVGARVKAHYDPANRAIAVLQPGFRRASLSWFAFGLVFFAVGCTFLFSTWVLS